MRLMQGLPLFEGWDFAGGSGLWGAEDCPGQEHSDSGEREGWQLAEGGQEGSRFLEEVGGSSYIVLSF